MGSGAVLLNAPRATEGSLHGHAGKDGKYLGNLGNGRLGSESRASLPEREGRPAERQSVLVIVQLRRVTGMVVIMVPMLTGVNMVMHITGSPMRVLMKMLVDMLMGVSVRMLVSVLLSPMGMGVGMKVRVVMGMKMLVLVLAFHGRPPAHQVFGTFVAPFSESATRLNKATHLYEIGS
jgi:hypothetical protein